MELQNARGVRDFGPKDRRIREYIIETIQDTFRRFGYLPLETPVIERMDVLGSKFTGGEEILKEIYKFEDQGGRKLGLRYDLTVPFARFIGMNKGMKMPFKRYQIDKVFRDGPVKTGRYREFYQCDADIVGCSEVNAEAELITMAFEVFSQLKLDFEMEVNNRKILKAIMDAAEVPGERQQSMILSIDKFEKVGKQGVEKELKEKGYTAKQIEKVFSFVSIEGSNEEKLQYLEENLESPLGKVGIKEMRELLELIDDSNPIFSPFLARGLAYYTGTIYEFFLRDRKKMKSSIGSGGRYDRMISDLLETDELFPAVGVSFGLDVIFDVMKNIEIPYAAELYVVPIGMFKEAFEIANDLRQKGIKVDIDLSGRSITKNLKYANSLKIPYVLIVGENEVKQQKYTLKNMINGDEKILSRDELILMFLH